MATRKKPIRINPANKGKLRKAAGKKKKGQKLTVAELKRLKNSRDPRTRKRANFALNAKTKFRKKAKR